MNGYMTYISAAVLFGATVAKQFGWIDEGMYQMLLGLAGTGGFVGIRRAVATEAGRNATGQAVIAQQVGVAPTVIATEIAPDTVTPQKSKPGAK